MKISFFHDVLLVRIFCWWEHGFCLVSGWGQWIPHSSARPVAFSSCFSHHIAAEQIVVWAQCYVQQSWFTKIRQLVDRVDILYQLGECCTLANFEECTGGVTWSYSICCQKAGSYSVSKLPCDWMDWNLPLSSDNLPRVAWMHVDIS